ncbi:DUF6934 family protein [Parapedobacter tibetensis]|uniref:DUF6934 family protein n=1 Tax=Parapedobacter tibetensis TaxID=2972951 RepID=UPI00358E1203
MNEDSYSFEKTPEVYTYEFYSEGPQGRIRKVVQYHLIDRIATFSIWDSETGIRKGMMSMIKRPPTTKTDKKYLRQWPKR